MKTIKKILVPTDFSEQSASAFPHAVEIGKKFGAKIDFIHIVPTLNYFYKSLSRMGAPIDMNGDLYPTVQKEAGERLQELMENHIPEELRGKVLSKIDRTAAARITDMADSGAYDLIVMASRGEHGTHLLRGSTTEKVIRHSDVPVFTVDAELSAEGLKKIMLPTDGSEISFSALPLALTLAETYEADITLYHVMELYGSPIENDSRDTDKSDEANIYATLMDRLEDYLMDMMGTDAELSRFDEEFEDQIVLKNGASSRTVNLFTVIEKGVSAHHGIEEYATENTDVVVMATHGYSGFAHFFLGSTTEKVAQHLSIPVLTVRPAREKLNKKE